MSKALSNANSLIFGFTFMDRITFGEIDRISPVGLDYT